MTDELMIVFGEDGIAREYKDDYDVTIHCKNKEEQDEVWKRLTQYDWTPCSDRPPEKEGRYLITVDEGDRKDVSDDFFYFRDDGVPSWYVEKNVIAWMPLPEPYRGEQDD